MSMKAPSVRLNVVANFVGKGWSAAMGLAFVPVYIHFLGIEAYGLVGFYTMLAAVFVFLDFGLSATINREMARGSQEDAAAQSMRTLVRTMEILYWIIAGLIAVVLVVLADLLADRWITPDELSSDTIRDAVLLLGMVIAVQWPFALYAGGLYGLQRQVLLNIFICSFATIRGVGAVLTLWLISPTIQVFFVWQIVFGLVSTLLIAVALWRSLPTASGRPRFRWDSLRKVWRFAIGVAAISMLGIFLQQMDKIVLSRMLTLDSFGYYTLAGVVASSILYLVSPIRSALYPRFSQMVANDEIKALTALYHKASQFMSITIWPIALWLIIFAEPIITLWTQDPMIAENTYRIAQLLVFGTALHAMLHLPYALQLAYGWTSLSVYANLVAIIVLVPALLYFVDKYGALGAASVWTLLNFGQLTITISLMHQRYLRGEQLLWYFKDIALPVIGALVPLILWWGVYNANTHPIVSFLQLAAALGTSVLVSTIVTPAARNVASMFIRKYQSTGALR